MDAGARAVHWGILGAGRIAGKFARALSELPDAELTAVGSRTQAKADTFAAQYGAVRAYGSYDDLIGDPHVDVVYVATPHPFHRDNTIACLQGGKGVLCEKPMAMNEAQVREMAGSARARNLFLMEAMWTRCLPVTQQVASWIESGRIGDVQALTIRIGFRTPWTPQDRWLNWELGGGALLDVGVYAVAYAHLVFGRPPERVVALGHMGATRVDEQTAVALQYDDGALAQLACALRTELGQHARVSGTNGWIDIPSFSRATSAGLHVSGEEPVEVEAEAGFRFEALEVMDCLRAGRAESSRMPLDESIEVAGTLDRAREMIGLRYAADDDA